MQPLKTLYFAAALTISLASCISLPNAPIELVGVEHGVSLSFSWTHTGREILGFVIERCNDIDECETAALIRADSREFNYFFMHPYRFRIAAFSKQGRSAWSALTPMLGRDPQGELMPYPETGRLNETDSAAGKLIHKSKLNSASMCSTPKKLLSQGFSLVCVHGLTDWYEESSSCGTGGCIFIAYTTENGCYSLSDELSFNMAAPCHGKNLSGLVYSNSRINGPYEGFVSIFLDAKPVGSYRWKSLEQVDFSVAVEESIQW